MYQLRRLHVNCDPRAVLQDDSIVLFQTTKIGRNPDLVDVVLLSSVHSNMISREHATIVVKQKQGKHTCIIKDHSLNGTYVNDYRVAGERTELKQGDVIKFGHVNGAAIKPGCHGPQTSAEFTFVFEEAPDYRVNDRRRPITVTGRSDAAETISFPSQVFTGDVKSIQPTTRLPLPNTPVEFAAPWQNSAAGAATAPSFYNLQRFPGYYQAAFPQLNPAYLQTLWPQNPWQQPAAAHQLQQHQLQQQQKQPSQNPQYSQLANASWVGTGAQIATDAISLIGAASEGQFRASQPCAPTKVTASAAQRRAPITNIHPTVTTNMAAQSANVLTSFAQRTAHPCVAGNVTSNASPAVDTSVPATTSHHFNSVSGGVRNSKPEKISQVPPECAITQMVATPSAVDSVKCVECDSSVPSPPKTHQLHSGTHSSHVALHSKSSNSAFEANGERPINDASTVRTTAKIPIVSDVEQAGRRSVQMSNMASTGSYEPQICKVMEERGGSPTKNPDELVDFLEDCGPPKRPAEQHAYTVASDVADGTHLQPVASAEEKSRGKSTPHQSPRRRGHGHSESSRSRSQTPATVEKPKVTAKRRRKSNEVSMLLNDLTEVAWSHLARKSTNRITPTQTRKVYTNDDNSFDSDSDCSEKSSKKQRRKAKRKNSTSSVSKKQSNSFATAKRGRGRPRKQGFSENKRNRRKKSAAKKSVEELSKSGSDSDLGNVKIKSPSVKPLTAAEKLERALGMVKKRPRAKDNKGGKKKKTVVKKMQSSVRSDTSHSGGDEVTAKLENPTVSVPSTSAEKIERALNMMNERRSSPVSDDSSDASFTSSSRSSPIRRTWTAASKKVVTVPFVSREKSTKGATNQQSQKAERSSKKRGRKPTKSKKKKNGSTSSDNESASDSTEDWGKVKQIVTPLPAVSQSDDAPAFDEWTYHDPDKQCDAPSGCKKPQSENVDWVQCDYCHMWYHVVCVVERYVVADNADDFDCGCRSRERSIES